MIRGLFDWEPVPLTSCHPSCFVRMSVKRKIVLRLVEERWKDDKILVRCITYCKRNNMYDILDLHLHNKVYATLEDAKSTINCALQKLGYKTLPDKLKILL